MLNRVSVIYGGGGREGGGKRGRISVKPLRGFVAYEKKTKRLEKKNNRTRRRPEEKSNKQKNNNNKIA